MFWASPIFGQWLHRWVYQLHHWKREVITGLTGWKEGSIVASFLLDWLGQLKIVEHSSDTWVISWIIFPVLEHGRYGGPMRYYSGQYIAVNFKQIQEAFAEGLAIDLKYIEAFCQTVLYESAPVGLIVTNQGGPQIGGDAIWDALAVNELDKQIPKMLFWASAIFGQWCHRWVYRLHHRKREVITGLTGWD